MKKAVEQLLSWMEQYLNNKSEFTVEDVARFFADNFVIDTNGRVVKATPQTYREYLYGLKSHLKGVKYEKEQMLEASDAVIAPFKITMDFTDKEAQNLLAISIFSFDEKGRITEWKEVFADLSQADFAYDE